MFHSKKFIWQFGGSPPPHSFSQCPFCWGSLASHKWSIAFVFFCRRIEWKKGKTIGARKKNPLNNSHRALIVPIHFSCPFASLSSLIIRAGQQKKSPVVLRNFERRRRRVFKRRRAKKTLKSFIIYILWVIRIFSSKDCKDVVTNVAITLQFLQVSLQCRVCSFFFETKREFLLSHFCGGANVRSEWLFYVLHVVAPSPRPKIILSTLCQSAPPPPLPQN